VSILVLVHQQTSIWRKDVTIVKNLIVFCLPCHWSTSTKGEVFAFKLN